jgi:hypothetical protein
LLSLAEIVRKAQKLETEDQKIEWLRQNDSTPLRQLLICTYDTDRIKFLIPNEPPPYKPSQHLDSQGMLHRQIRKLQYVIAGEAVHNISQYKREWVFIEMLESVDPEDAELLCDMVRQKPLTGLSAAVINKAFGDIISKSAEIVEDKTVKPTAQKAKKSNGKEV